MNQTNKWPTLEYIKIKDTLDTVHQWIQIVGKIRLRSMPWQNHSWHAALYITPTGFSTNAIPYEGRLIQIDFNFKTHDLILTCSNKGNRSFPLKAMTVADFYTRLFGLMEELGINVSIHQSPNEMEPAIPFKENTVNKSYERDSISKLWMAMLKSNEVFTKFRSKFIGKCSPVHLFWGAFDLAVTRFSGRGAPLHQGGMPNMPLDVMQEAYSKEVSSAGFWPGSAGFPEPAYYAYAYPSSSEFGQQEVSPAEAFYSQEMGEYFLKYSDVQKAEDPEQTLLDFLETTYQAAAITSDWDDTDLLKSQ